ncbi:MAG: hypothetical protein EBR67_05280, partial [Proteobacteria bacterium]|nr:hypothetical protein [Pseudomonadota bacterium]
DHEAGENTENGVVQQSLQLDWFSRKLNREQVRELAVLKTLYEVYQMLKALPESKTQKMELCGDLKSVDL